MDEHAGASAVGGDAGHLAVADPHRALVAVRIHALRPAGAHDAVQQRRGTSPGCRRLPTGWPAGQAQGDAQRAGVEQTAPPPVKRRQTRTPRAAQAPASISQSARWKRPITTAGRGAPQQQRRAGERRRGRPPRPRPAPRPGRACPAGSPAALRSHAARRRSTRSPARCSRIAADGGADAGSSTISGSSRSSWRRAPRSCAASPSSARSRGRALELGRGTASAAPRWPQREPSAQLDQLPARRAAPPRGGRRRAPARGRQLERRGQQHIHQRLALGRTAGRGVAGDQPAVSTRSRASSTLGPVLGAVGARRPRPARPARRRAATARPAAPDRPTARSRLAGDLLDRGALRETRRSAAAPAPRSHGRVRSRPRGPRRGAAAARRDQLVGQRQHPLQLAIPSCPRSLRLTPPHRDRSSLAWMARAPMTWWWPVAARPGSRWRRRWRRRGYSVLVCERSGEIGVPVRTSGGSWPADLRALGLPDHLWHPIDAALLPLPQRPSHGRVGRPGGLLAGRHRDLAAPGRRRPRGRCDDRDGHAGAAPTAPARADPAPRRAHPPGALPAGDRRHRHALAAGPLGRRARGFPRGSGSATSASCRRPASPSTRP